MLCNIFDCVFFLRLKINKEKSYVLFSYVFFFATYN